MFLTEPFPNIHSLSLFLVMATEDMSMFVAVRTLVKCNYYLSLKELPCLFPFLWIRWKKAIKSSPILPLSSVNGFKSF